MKTVEHKLTEMQKFAIDFLDNKMGEWINPAHLGQQWHFFKTGRYGSGASRDAFGRTSAAYRTLRKLHKMGLVARTISGIGTPYIDEKYRSIKHSNSKQ